MARHFQVTIETPDEVTGDNVASALASVGVAVEHVVELHPPIFANGAMLWARFQRPVPEGESTPTGDKHTTALE